MFAPAITIAITNKVAFKRINYETACVSGARGLDTSAGDVECPHLGQENSICHVSVSYYLQ